MSPQPTPPRAEGDPAIRPRHPSDPPQTPPEKAGEPLLRIRGLGVQFGGFHALTDVDFDAREGEVHFLIGPNGAGKTTLVDIITGLTKPTTGSVSFDGQQLVGHKEHRIVHFGVGRTFQAATVFEALTVGENLDLAASYRLGLRRLLRQPRGHADAVVEALEVTGLADEVDKSAGALAHGQKQWLEIGMLLAQGPRLLLLDEPVAGMSPDERTRTGELIRYLARGRTVLVVEHDMDFMRRFADRVTVLHEGRILRADATVAEVQADPTVQEVYIGRARDDRNSAGRSGAAAAGAPAASDDEEAA
ncbi:Urea ABC transporter ATPase protein UrtD [Patulibacter medicamentivorans]|jgi:urea transport system ATP-binding protein|uniref:Urea ABC transporter ATPase protein UrtD n=1 Tax=Patulibacter medicamentivorans TaxID=1097667 RepID=H0EB19_9ACTN|nr:urea ABC transporter ATP-binding protein UrtD [Patulibacter medicamentivorans]EHN09094.1 Urea ABC transporter ATPase protein UrtD [Patulibacter medicamentivorans]